MTQLFHMKNGKLEPGQAVNIRGRVGVIRHSDGEATTLKFHDGQVQAFETPDLVQLLANGELFFVTSVTPARLSTGITQDQEEEIYRRQEYVLELAQQDSVSGKGVRESVIKDVSAKITDTNPPSIATIHRWYLQWIRDGKDMSLQVVYKNRERKKGIDSVAEALIELSIRHDYCKRSKPSAKGAYRKFLERIAADSRASGTPPSYDTYRRRIAEKDRAEIIKAREGAAVRKPLKPAAHSI